MPYLLSLSNKKKPESDCNRQKDLQKTSKVLKQAAQPLNQKAIIESSKTSIGSNKQTDLPAILCHVKLRQFPTELSLYHLVF